MIRPVTLFLLGAFLLCPFMGFTSEPPAGTATFNLVKEGKPKYRPTHSSTFMTLNVENIWFDRQGPFFQFPDNFAYGLKFGTMYNVGWYLSAMSNFNFSGFLKPMKKEEINPAAISHTYIDGLFGLTFRYCKSTSFHIGVGYKYRTTNYKSMESGSWGQLSDADRHGPMAAAGFMFHMKGFVLSAEAVGSYYLQEAPKFLDHLDVGVKLGIGFCVESKGSTQKTTKKKKKSSDKMPASELHFMPTTAGPDEYGVVFRHSYTKPQQDLVAILENDTLLSKLPQPEKLKSDVQEEERLTVLPVVNETVETVAPQQKSEVQQPDPVVPKQEEVTPAENKPVDVTEEKVEPAVAQPEKQQEQIIQDLPQKPLSESKENTDKQIIPALAAASVALASPCNEPTVKDIDGNSYNTLLIGNQCWLRENMRTTRYADGESIQLSQAPDGIHAVRYCPNNDSANVSNYGYLYNWNAMTHGNTSTGAAPLQGVCPAGWHVPSMAEWEALFGFLAAQPDMSCQGESLMVAKALAAKTGWAESVKPCAIGNTPSSNNTSGFNAMPAGMFFGRFDFFGKAARFWSSTSSVAQGKCDVFMFWDEGFVKTSDQEPSSVGFSVRCVKN